MARVCTPPGNQANQPGRRSWRGLRPNGPRDGLRDVEKPLGRALPEHAGRLIAPPGDSKTLTGVRFCKMFLRVIRIYSTILGALGIYEKTY